MTLVVSCMKNPLVFRPKSPVCWSISAVVCFIWSGPTEKRIHCRLLVLVWFVFTLILYKQTVNIHLYIDWTVLASDFLYYQRYRGNRILLIFPSPAGALKFFLHVYLCSLESQRAHEEIIYEHHLLLVVVFVLPNFIGMRKVASNIANQSRSVVSFQSL